MSALLAVQIVLVNTPKPDGSAVLVQETEYPCYISVGWSDEHYEDNFGKNKVFAS